MRNLYLAMVLCISVPVVAQKNDPAAKQILDGGYGFVYQRTRCSSKK